jgi:hypothetical protein
MIKEKEIVIGLVLFCLLFTAPFWLNTGNSAAAAPRVVISAAAGAECVLSAAEMRERHMQVLDEWRTASVRAGQSFYPTGGAAALIGFEENCLTCHANREEFCDLCHAYTAVEPDCWDCHHSVGAAP